MKKIYSSLLLLVFALTPLLTSAESYTAELQSAYDYAYSINVTTMPTIDTANMNGNLIRSHMAKMMVNYAKRILGKSADTSLACEFTDIARQSDELKGYIKEACQMGLMGQEITAFKPNAVVTRAEFGTVLSRALRGDLFDGVTPYYQDHLQALKNVKIMTVIDNPAMTEVRGYVMLMMMRVVQGGETDSICDTPEHHLACFLDMNTCPSQCKIHTTAAGTLSTQINTDSYAIPDAVHLGSLKLGANNASILVYNITFTAEGANNRELRLEQDGKRISEKVTPTSDGKVILTVAGMRINAGNSVVLHIVADKAITSLKITDVGGFDSSALSVLGSFPMCIF